MTAYVQIGQDHLQYLNRKVQQLNWINVDQLNDV